MICKHTESVFLFFFMGLLVRVWNVHIIQCLYGTRVLIPVALACSLFTKWVLLPLTGPSVTRCVCVCVCDVPCARCSKILSTMRTGYGLCDALKSNRIVAKVYVKPFRTCWMTYCTFLILCLSRFTEIKLYVWLTDLLI